MKKFALYLLIALYLLAGINHFWHPSFYLRLILPYLPYHSLINYASGVAEFLLGVMVIFPKTRRTGALCIIMLLVAFIPSHIYSLQIACPGVSGCAMQWVAWVRLFIIHPMLIAWAWWIAELTKTSSRR